jgi:DNA-binding transcriptional LysR family regulator
MQLLLEQLPSAEPCGLNGPAVCGKEGPMELRILRYFLTVAAEGNITRAAELLHLTQPTLSRQLSQLEGELGVRLFERGSHHITLTEEGHLLCRRAREIVELTDKATEELSHREEVVAGMVTIGCAETTNMQVLAKGMKAFQEQYPHVSFAVYTATADEVIVRIDRGLFDFGLLMEPAELGKYNFIRFPRQEQYQLLLCREDPLAARDRITPEDLQGQNLILAKRESARNVFENWAGSYFATYKIAGFVNLSLYNTLAMIEAGLGKGITPLDVSLPEKFRRIPLSPSLPVGTVLVWTKNQRVSRTVALFETFIRAYILGMNQPRT